MKTLKVEGRLFDGLLNFRRRLLPIFHALSMRSTTPAGSTPRSAT